MKGISAVIATILMLMITIALAGVAYMYISGIFTAKTGIVLELDATATKCTGTTITVYLRNTGTIATDASKIILDGTDSTGTPITGGACGADTIALNAGAGSAACTQTLTGTAGTNTIVARGPTNTVRGVKYCSG